MQNKKITAQDIADKLNISRNTVSKLHLRWAIRIFLKKIKILLLKIKKLHFSPLICQTLHTLVLNFYLDLKKR